MIVRTLFPKLVNLSAMASEPGRFARGRSPRLYKTLALYRSRIFVLAYYMSANAAKQPRPLMRLRGGHHAGNANGGKCDRVRARGCPDVVGRSHANLRDRGRNRPSVLGVRANKAPRWPEHTDRAVEIWQRLRTSEPGRFARGRSPRRHKTLALYRRRFRVLLRRLRCRVLHVRERGEATLV